MIQLFIQCTEDHHNYTQSSIGSNKNQPLPNLVVSESEDEEPQSTTPSLSRKLSHSSQTDSLSIDSRQRVNEESIFPVIPIPSAPNHIVLNKSIPQLMNKMQSLPLYGIICYEESTHYWYIKLPANGKIPPHLSMILYIKHIVKVNGMQKVMN